MVPEKATIISAWMLAAISLNPLPLDFEICFNSFNSQSPSLSHQAVDSQVRNIVTNLYRAIERAAGSSEAQAQAASREYRLSFGEERFPFELQFEVERALSPTVLEKEFNLRPSISPLTGDQGEIDLYDEEALAARLRSFFSVFMDRAREIGLNDRVTITLKSDMFLPRIGFYSTIKDFQVLLEQLLRKPMLSAFGERLFIAEASVNTTIYGWDRAQGYEGQWQLQNKYLIRLMTLYHEGKSFDQIAAAMNQEFDWVESFKKGKWTAQSTKALIDERLERMKREAALGFSSTPMDQPLK